MNKNKNSEKKPYKQNFQKFTKKAVRKGQTRKNYFASSMGGVECPLERFDHRRLSSVEGTVDFGLMRRHFWAAAMPGGQFA